MMQWMHNLSRSWFATLLLGGLALSFVAWGIGDMFTGFGSTGVATIGSTDISQRSFDRSYRNYVRNRGQELGQDITPDMARSMGLGGQVLQQIISRTALDNAAKDLGLMTPDAAVTQSIQSIPGFRGATGRFDPATFTRLVQAANYTPDDFFAEVRNDLTRAQLTGAVEGNFIIPAGYAQALFLFLNERRAVDYVIVSPDSLGPIAPPDDTALAAFVKANPQRFSTPEYRAAEYAEIGPEDMLAGINVTDQQIQQEFDARKATYIVPEKRELEQLPFPTEAEAKTARANLATGTSFDAMIKARGFKTADISSTVSQSELPDAEIAKAAFSLPFNGVSEPLKSTFGYVLVRVTKIEPGSNKSFADVKEDIRKAVGLQLANAKIIDIVNAYEDARSGGAGVAEAAKKAGMKPGRVAAIDATGKAPDGNPAAAPQDPEFVTQLFRAEIGEDGDPFQAKSGRFYAVKVNGQTLPKLKSLTQVHAQAVEAWTQDSRAKLLTARAAALGAQAQKENSLATLASVLKVPVQHSPGLGRGTDDTMFPAALMQQIFAAKPGGIVSGGQGQSGNFVIAKITGIAHPQVTPNSPGFARGAQELSQNISGDFTLALASAARDKQGVKINQKLVDSTIGGGS